MMKPEAAHLTSDLLAPKGTATPAQRPVVLHPHVRLVANEHPMSERRRGRPHLSQEDRRSRVKHTVRLDPGRHLRLKLASAHLNESAQTILIHALDAYLDHVAPSVMSGGCGCLASKGAQEAD